MTYMIEGRTLNNRQKEPNDGLGYKRKASPASAETQSAQTNNGVPNKRRKKNAKRQKTKAYQGQDAQRPESRLAPLKKLLKRAGKMGK